jgi:inhibitor of cysteine peptidase
MDRSASTPQCGRCRFEFAENAEAPGIGSAVPDLQFQTKDDGTAANIPVGRRFQISLEENPTTGYRWLDPEFDKACLRLESADYVAHQGGAIGGGGIRQFEFSVTGQCRTTIHLVYKRPWEPNAAPQKTFALTVIGTS